MIINKKIKINKPDLQAFTIIEALVSIALLLVVVIAPLTLIFNAVNYISQNKNRVIASYLAEESIEDLMAYRDGFALACTDLSIEYVGGEVSSGVCNKGGANLVVPIGLLTDPSYTSNSIAWELFITNLSEVINKKDFLDSSSFKYDNLNSKLLSYNDCRLSLSTNLGYYCGGTDYTPFTRSITITKTGKSVIKVEVEVVYAVSGLIGLDTKSVKVVNYIYER